MSDVYDETPMSNPRFVPRTFATEPAVFGRARLIEWRTVSEHQKVQLEAAMWQHLVAWSIYRALKANSETLRVYCERTGQPYQRASNMLNGRILMRLEDVVSARIHLGVDVHMGA